MGAAPGKVSFIRKVVTMENRKIVEFYIDTDSESESCVSSEGVREGAAGSSAGGGLPVLEEQDNEGATEEESVTEGEVEGDGEEKGILEVISSPGPLSPQGRAKQ